VGLERSEVDEQTTMPTMEPMSHTRTDEWGWSKALIPIDGGGIDMILETGFIIV
jgi:hypothetical protein